MSGKTAQTGQLESDAIGFMTVCFDATVGYIGGYLLLNRSGRPLEFHCTAPVRPNRAQEILYGPTLKPFVYGEQIGRALWDKAGLRPWLLATDVEPATALSSLIEAPMVLVAEAEEAAEVIMQARGGWTRLQLGPNPVLAPPGRPAAEAEAVELAWRQADVFIDLLEPFERIRSC